ncbi:hypothetical protein LOTGIDRAFT_238005 [Lottia gigantea]|uniref:Spaetzle domain-containing protein n=1 Tax=Lottia gigantea TaxID=225164 RepID=V4B4I4_LOTGI|nr:hypothetical protein LOTGIDRAFT_238005 [Lottia gigantea]ESP02381.1 hypothetical protein LOTGIDRAFT_238005 [Lottia gigantea]
MKVLLCLAAVVSFASAMFAPQINGFSDFSDPAKFDNGFNGGIGEGKTFDVNDMHNFPDFSHGFGNFDDSKGTPDQHVFNAPNKNLNNNAEQNFDDQHLNNFLSKGDAGIPGGFRGADHNNGFINDTVLVAGTAAAPTVGSGGGVGSVTADQQNGLANRPPGCNPDHESGFVTDTITAAGSVAANQGNVADSTNKQNVGSGRHNHISHDVTNDIHNGIHFKQRNGVYQPNNQFAPEQEFHGNSFDKTHADHDSNINLPSVEDLHKHIPTPVVFKPTIAPFVHPDGPVGGPVTVSDIQFDHPDPPKKFTHDGFPSFNGRQSKFSRANDIPGFFSDPFGSVGGSSGHRKGLNSQSCPTINNPAAPYVLSSTASDYPREDINAELARRPGLRSMVANNGQQKPSLDVVDGTASCVSSQNSLRKFRRYNGACYVLDGEAVDMVDCQSANCNQCNTSGAQSNIQGLCVPQYQNINVMAYCVNAPDANNKINRELVPVPSFCGCRMVQC